MKGLKLKDFEADEVMQKFRTDYKIYHFGDHNRILFIYNFMEQICNIYLNQLVELY
jgi:hypothetical protein